jgi:hypothetical protein
VIEGGHGNANPKRYGHGFVIRLGACAAQPQGAARTSMAPQIRSEPQTMQRTGNVPVTFEEAPRPNRDGAHQTIIAAGVPTLNSEASCHNPFDKNVDRCLAEESSARDQLAHKWTEFPTADRLHCMRYSSAGGGGTYTDLLTCLELELDVRNLHEKNRSVANQ